MLHSRMSSMHIVTHSIRHAHRVDPFVSNENKKSNTCLISLIQSDTCFGSIQYRSDMLKKQPNIFQERQQY